MKATTTMTLTILAALVATGCSPLESAGESVTSELRRGFERLHTHDDDDYVTVNNIDTTGEISDTPVTVIKHVVTSNVYIAEDGSNCSVTSTDSLDTARIDFEHACEDFDRVQCFTLESTIGDYDAHTCTQNTTSDVTVEEVIAEAGIEVVIPEDSTPVVVHQPIVVAEAPVVVETPEPVVVVVPEPEPEPEVVVEAPKPAPVIIVQIPNDYGVDNSPYQLDNIAINNTYTPGGAGWMDSYSIVASTGKEYCFIDSTLDHDVGQLKIDLPEGGKITIREARDSQTDHPFYRARNKNVDPMFNDAQCGNGPANDYGDEDVDQCPGRVDMGKGGCGIQGPRFTLVK